MDISVIIPAYNEENYIGKCLESIKNQEVKPDETIVVDNNCTDNTVVIAKQYGAKIVQEKKQGMIFARNTGFNYATGDILARCDADVTVHSDWIKKIKNYFLSHPQIAAVSGPARFHDLPIIGRFSQLFVLYSYIMRILLGHHTLIGPNMALTRKVWQKVKNNICLNNKLVHEDIDLSIHIDKYGKIAFDPSLEVAVSGRRIKYNPLSFFGEYQLRLIKTLAAHKR